MLRFPIQTCAHTIRIVRPQHRVFVSFGRRPCLPPIQVLSKTVYRNLTQEASQFHATRGTEKQNLTLPQRITKFLRDNPYTRFSLVLCGVVLGLSLSFEFYTKHKKKKLPDVVLLPPRVGHYTAERTAEIAAVDANLRTLKKHGKSGILYIVGPSGAGKSELAYQYSQYFTENSTNLLRRSQKPVVLYVNGTTEDMLETTLREAALVLGIKESEYATPEGHDTNQARLVAISRAFRSKLRTIKSPWLMIVDNLRGEVIPRFTSVFSSAAAPLDEEWDWRKGSVVVTTREHLPSSVPKESILHLDHRLPPAVAVDLLMTLSGMKGEHQAAKLAERLQYCPFTIALAASTIKLYASFLEQESGESPLATYTKVLNSSISDNDSNLENITRTAIALYSESAISDPSIRHAFNLFGSCDPHHPIPASLVGRHLTHPFYRILPPPAPYPSGSGTPALSTSEEASTSGPSAYLAQLKSILPFGKKEATLGPTQPDLSSLLYGTDDSVAFLRSSPLLAFKKYSKTGVELLHVHSSASSELSCLFTKYTTPKLDKDHLVWAEDTFNRTAWFRQYRSFDASQALLKYHRSLPGLSAPGVLTQKEFEINTPRHIDVQTAGTKASSERTYAEYSHLVSHYHRVLSSLTTELKSAGADIEDTQLKKYLQSHLKAVGQFPLVSTTDRMMSSYGLLSIETALSPTSDYPKALQKYEAILEQQRSVYGNQHPAVARTLTDMADMKFTLSDATGAKQLLESALHIYEKQPQHVRDNHLLDIGLALVSMGIVVSTLGDKERCLELMEGALGVYQTLPPDGKVTKNQRKVVANTLTDLAHAYLSVGDLNSAKKYIDQANMAHRNMYPEPHSAMVRTLNVMSIVYALLGDKPESEKVRLEAAKLKTEIESQPIVL